MAMAMAVVITKVATRAGAVVHAVKVRIVASFLCCYITPLRLHICLLRTVFKWHIFNMFRHIDSFIRALAKSSVSFVFSFLSLHLNSLSVSLLEYPVSHPYRRFACPSVLFLEHVVIYDRLTMVPESYPSFDRR